MSEDISDQLVFVGYTNGHQVLYATEAEGGEGAFYSSTESECYIPLYMLKKHAHRLKTTSNMSVSLDRVRAAQKP